MKIESRFDLGDGVTIIHGELKAAVTGFRVDRVGTLWVTVRYVNDNSTMETEHFLEDELRAAV